MREYAGDIYGSRLRDNGIPQGLDNVIQQPSMTFGALRD